MNGMRRSDIADSRGTDSSQASGQVGWRENDRNSASLMRRALQDVKAQPKPSEDRPPGIPEPADGSAQPRQQQQQSAAPPAGSSVAAAPAEAAATATGDQAQKPMPHKATQLKADSPAFQPGAFAKSKATVAPPPPPAQARVFQPQGMAAQAAPPFQPHSSTAPAAASMAPPGYIGSYGQPYPGSQGMMEPSVPSVGMGMEYEPSTMGGEGYQGDWGYSMPAVTPASDQWPAHLGPNTVDSFWHQVRYLATAPQQSACVTACLCEGISAMGTLPELTYRTTGAAVCQLWPLHPEPRVCPPGPSAANCFWDQVRHSALAQAIWG